MSGIHVKVKEPGCMTSTVQQAANLTVVRGDEVVVPLDRDVDKAAACVGPPLRDIAAIDRRVMQAVKCDDWDGQGG